MKLNEVLKEVDILQGKTQLFTLLIEHLKDVRDGKVEVFDKELGDNLPILCNEVGDDLDNMKKEVLQQLEKIHNAEVCFDKSDSDRSTKGKSTPTAVAKASSKARSGKSK